MTVDGLLSRLTDEIEQAGPARVVLLDEDRVIPVEELIMLLRKHRAGLIDLHETTGMWERMMRGFR